MGKGEPPVSIAQLVTVFVTCTLLFLAARAFEAPVFEGYGWLGKVCRGVIVFVVASALFDIVRELRHRSILAARTRALGVYGSFRVATRDDLKQMGLLDAPGPDRFFLGAFGKEFLSAKIVSHGLIVAPSNTGKTESIVIPNCLCLETSLFVTDKAGEVAARVHAHRAELLGQAVYVINPWHCQSDAGLPNHHFNPLDRLIELARENDPSIIDEAWRLANLLVEEPERAGDGAFFRQKARDLLVWLMIHTAYRQAYDGELVCSLPGLYRIVNGSVESLAYWFAEMQAGDDLGEMIRLAGQRYASLANATPKTFQSVLAECQNSLAIFDPVSPLGQSMELSGFRMGELKEKPTSVFLVAPPDKLIGPHGKWASVVIDTAISSCMAAQSRDPRVVFLLDEFANISKEPLPSVIPALYIGRGLGIHLFPMVQDRESLKRYPEPAAFETQADFICFWGVKSHEDADFISKRAGQTSIVTESVNSSVRGESIPADQAGGVTLSENALPVIRPDQVLQLEKRKTIILYQNYPVIVADLISYRMVSPWHAQARALGQDAQEPPLPVRFRL